MTDDELARKLREQEWAQRWVADLRSSGNVRPTSMAEGMAFVNFKRWVIATWPERSGPDELAKLIQYKILGYQK